MPPEALRFHIAEAVRVAGATRIGHGVDILYEDNPAELLAKTARNRVLVEINLTSNAVIPGVEGVDHPFETYRQFGVPLALSTDDEGVSRIDLTHGYRRAVETYGLGHVSIKELSRNSLTCAFVDGASRWPDTGYDIPVAACREAPLGPAELSRDCAAFFSGEREGDAAMGDRGGLRPLRDVPGAGRALTSRDMTDNRPTDRPDGGNPV